MARPTKLTPALREQVCKAIAAGNYAHIAAEASGISERTYYSWLERGRAALDLDKVPATERPYLQFLQAVMRASAQAEATATEAVRKAMEGWIEDCPACEGSGRVQSRESGKTEDPRGSTTRARMIERVCGACNGAGRIVHEPDGRLALQYLERRHPDRWGRRVTELQGSETGPAVGIVAAVHAPAADEQPEQTEEVARAAHDFLRTARKRREAPVDPGPS